MLYLVNKLFWLIVSNDLDGEETMRGGVQGFRELWVRG